MSDPDTLKERIQKHSWASLLILPSPDSGSSSPGCAFSNAKKPHQHAFTTRIVPPSDNCRSMLIDSRGDGITNRESKACEGRNNNVSDNTSDNYEVKDDKSQSESTNGTTREFLDLMAAVKHLPSETQNALVLHFLDERRVQNRGDVKLE